MNPDELILTTEDFDSAGHLRALRQLETTYVPKLRGKSPFWSPPTPTCWQEIHEPSWNWVSPARDQFPELTVLDCNGAFLAPLSGTEMALGALENTGPLASLTSRQVLPGYYLINSAEWQNSDLIVSPLGDGPLPPQLWVAAPTMHLLLQLQEDGMWPGIRVFDSWTSDQKMRMSKWAAWLKAVRLLAMNTDEQRALTDPDTDPSASLAVKNGYAKAFQLMRKKPERGKPRKSKVFRPDWYHAVRTQHLANMWRKTHKMVNRGVPVTFMGHVDEIEIPTDILQILLDMPADPRRPIPIDLTGRELGSFKIKTVGEEAR